VGKVCWESRASLISVWGGEGLARSCWRSRAWRELISDFWAWRSVLRREMMRSFFSRADSSFFSWLSRKATLAMSAARAPSFSRT
jgi:hypothetical protein